MNKRPGMFRSCSELWDCILAVSCTVVAGGAVLVVVIGFVYWAFKLIKFFWTGG